MKRPARREIVPPAPKPPLQFKARVAPPSNEMGKAVEGGIFISDEQLLRLLPEGVPKEPARARRELRMLLADMRERQPIYGPTDWPEQFRSGVMRIGTHEDRDNVLALVRHDLRNNAQRVAPIAPDRVEAAVDACLVMESGLAPMGSVCALCQSMTGAAVGAVGLMPMQWWWSQQWYLQEVFCYVHPDYRKDGHAAALIQFSKAWVDKMTEAFGYRVHLIMGMLGLERIKETARLYARHMNPCGAAFVYPMPTDVS